MSWDSHRDILAPDVVWTFDEMAGTAPVTEQDATFRARLAYVGHELAHLHGKQLDDLAETLGLRRRGA